MPLLDVMNDDILYAYVYLNSDFAVPQQIRVAWHSEGSWAIAYWGAEDYIGRLTGYWGVQINPAVDSTPGWVRLEMSASELGLGGFVVDGVALNLYHDAQATQAALTHAGRVRP